MSDLDLDIGRVGDAHGAMPGSAPQAADPFGDRHGPYEATQMLSTAIGAYPADVADAVAAHGPIPGEAGKLIRDAEQAIANAPATAKAAILAAERLAADDRVAPDGKRRLLREAADKAEQDLQTAQRQVDTHIALAESELTVMALPKLPAGEEQTARLDARLQLDHLTGFDRAQAMAELARQGDSVAALLAGPWGRAALRAGGLSGDDVTTSHRAVVDAAIDAAASGDDETRRAAARHRNTIAKLRGQRDALGSLARLTANGMRERHGLPAPHVMPPLPARR